MARTYNIGNEPPEIVWTIIRGDTAKFKVYVTNDAREPLTITDWNIQMDIERGGTDVLTLFPEADADDEAGEFTVSLTAAQSEQLETGDVFDIQLSLPQDQIVWTVGKGSFKVIEDITDPFLES